jgi:Protein of unknown function (DUF3099)
MVHRPRQRDVALVTDAQRPMSEDIAFRERRYLVMMGIRVLCFVVAIVLFVAHAGWLAAIPAAGAIVIPYFAVVFANGGREPSSTRGLRPYEPNLPERYEGSSPSSSRSATDDSSASSGSGEGHFWHPDTPDDYRAH